MTQFNQLGLAEPIQRALAAKDYNTPTPIQIQAIPPLLEGRDLCGIAQTGTGKTAAFSLPSLHYLSENPMRSPHKACRMLILSPTRELASQIAENIRGYAKFMRLSVETVFGGVPVGKQKRKLEQGVDILVATPGRLLDLIDQRALKLDQVEIFVLDEADQMLDLGFIHDLKRLAKLLPHRRQSLFFSATMPKNIEQLAKGFLRDPVKVSVAPQATTAERVEQRMTFVNQAEKQGLLTLTLRDQEIERALIFSRTKHGADRIVRFLAGANIGAAAIHGNKSQPQREAALRAFRDGDIKYLVATDIAARGIDIPAVSHVINFDMPNVPEQYVHRIGRTARAGASGIAISYVNNDDERSYLKQIERLTGVKLKPQPLPEDFMAQAAKLPKAAPRKSGKSQGGNRRGPSKGGRNQRGGEQKAGQGQKRRRNRNRNGVGAHRGAVQRQG
ncbi:DEAD/DEAH box helicase [Parasphingopyxis lamellibrachiae]|uniref:DEAD-box ATP-dependent RNA helicase RhpA n=1 Tax=Parasphingopyxis lamellibrachiae TaxID=680125 RepID=A0A3D9FIC7_9SPHN|nr:DEAD/DEAH box helicase [Parasphingopyxis lamellibrachiae]RED17540.1 ATP-dependent RNA helicase RhlE [Parasphingopyxis lamellibrachiae]